MSALQKIADAEAKFRATTTSYPLWESRVTKGYYANPRTTAWWQALDLLEQAKAELQTPPGQPGTGGLVYLWGDKWGGN